MAILACATTAVAASEGAAGPASDDSAPLNASEVVVTIDLRTNGSAVWTITYHYRLDSPSRRQGFAEFRRRIDANRPSYVRAIRRDIQSMVRYAANRTGRSMFAAGVRVRTRRQSVPHEVGTVVHRFVWRGFATVNGTSMRVGDAIRSFYLGPRTVLNVEWPSSYSSVAVEPAADSRGRNSVSWIDGEFDGDEPRIVLTRSDGMGTIAWLSIAGVFLLVTSAGVLALGGQGGGPFERRWHRSANDDGPDAVGDADATAAAPGGERPPGPLSDAERVKWVLDAHGGRVKQQRIADECGWGDSKTSKVITEMEDAGEIDRFRLGRENVITLPEVKFDEV